ncbi:M91 family zinc metallopeptidase [Sphingomonas sp. Y38-1Y]|uniref:M91 family zinc metallopeptidase n=1 Tax=Sphingomonas sp. Y38-1Y TaxID=3078265 RepID=UPI0028EE4979|nr:M91 family zinc metallopeptidase [Sphingomonas sp. Y38-1Y]
MVGFPAARIGDMHVCPMVTGIVPHVGGPVSGPCAPTVLTGAMPQARIGDMCVCVGPPDVIATGAFTTIVSGSPAARILDMTAHGGVIVMGMFTVLIGMAGGAAPPTMVQVFPNVTVRGTPEFVEATLRAMAAIAATPSGAKMLADLQATGKPVTILESAPGGDSCGDFGSGATDGTGSGSTVRWNPNPSTMYDGSEPWMNAPPGVILGHEMTHATHVARGEASMAKVQNDHLVDPTHPSGYNHYIAEEVRTAGIPPYNDAATPYSENSIRAEWDPPQPQRRYY